MGEREGDRGVREIEGVKGCVAREEREGQGKGPE